MTYSLQKLISAQTQSISLSAAQVNQHHGLDQSANSLCPKSSSCDQISTDDLWDPWPDGDFERLFTWEVVSTY